MNKDLINKTFNNYEICYSADLNETESTGLVLKHKKSGARVCLVSNSDENKVFCIGFRTTPFDSTGVPHIIEHSVLCGSKKYPVKDPFIELAKSSLNTFLNAMTYPDKTIYPVASCNEQDIKNLMSVYMDAVFYPDIYRHIEIFKQEGWRYEIDSKDAELKINGVVYNEMKGAYSSVEDLLERDTMKALFPDTTYAYSSGGDPDVIPDLSYDDFLDFHKRYYHPSNSYIYLYGDFDMEERLEWLDKEYLSKFDYAPVDSEIPLQKGFRKVKYIEGEYPIGDDEDEAHKTYLGYNVVIDDILDVKKAIAWDCLHYALFGSVGAPVKQALIDAGIGKDILGGFNYYIRQTYLDIVAKDTDAFQIDYFVKIIEDTLKEQVEKGINKDTLLAGINIMDFSNREGDSGSYPKGLLYCINMFNSWLYDDNAAFSYCFQQKIFEELREAVNTDYFEKLIVDDVLNNTHKVINVMKPVKGLTSRKENELKKKLAIIKGSFLEEEIENLVLYTKYLKDYQDKEDSPEAIATLPSLKVKDVKKEAEKTNNKLVSADGTNILFHDIATNGISYIKFMFDVGNLKEEYWQYAVLAVEVLGRMLNTSEHSYIELTNEMAKTAGGAGMTFDNYSLLGAVGEYKTYASVGVKVFTENTAKALGLIAEWMTKSDFDDKKRIKDIMGEYVSGKQMQLLNAGHTTALSRTQSYFSPVAYFKQKTEGIDMYEFARDIYNNFDEKIDEVIANMKKAIAGMFNTDKMFVNLISRQEGFDALAAALGDFKAEIGKLSQTGTEDLFADERPAFTPDAKNEAFKISGQVQYAATAGNYKKAGYEFDGALAVMRTILAYDYLWMNVRVKGGAYGCFFSYEAIGGNCGIVSYRDPNLKATYEVYKDAADYIRNIELSEEEIEKYIIGTLSRTDAPKSPRAKGSFDLSCYISGIDDEFLQKERDQIIGADLESIRRMGDILECAVNQGYICTVGTEAKCTEDADLFKSVKTLA